MARNVLLIQLAPPEVCARVMAAIRAGDPEATVVVLSRSDQPAMADENVPAGSAGEVLSAVRARRFDVALVIHGRDQYRRAAYWRAWVVAALSGARRKAFCEDGAMPGRSLLGALVAGQLRCGLHALRVALAAAVAGLVMGLVVLGVALTGLLAGLVRVGRSQGRPKPTIG